MNRPAGYKRPPTATQFKPGQSGNPRGRPPTVRNFKTDLLDELHEQTTIRENGLDQQISKQRAFVKVLVAAAIKGDMRATNTLVAFCTRALGGQPEPEVEPAAGADDLDIVERYVARERKRRRLEKAEAGETDQQEEKDAT
jgi:hypothetical protein